MRFRTRKGTIFQSQDHIKIGVKNNFRIYQDPLSDGRSGAAYALVDMEGMKVIRYYTNRKLALRGLKKVARIIRIKVNGEVITLRWTDPAVTKEGVEVQRFDREET